MRNTIKSKLLVAAITAVGVVQSVAAGDPEGPGGIGGPVVTVPEPGMLSLIGVGIVIMLAAKYKNRNK
ncbi:MAG: PEP-CTERM sorting domain-containing protein [Pseudomonadales bacterium]|nr:PEP-CTERM sorting domain-containing protein [Pseudomonadales bacterium]MDG2079416.1 PEP-CTERM sorting domain-containing protein [Pseudomonadales bacterium]